MASFGDQIAAARAAHLAATALESTSRQQIANAFSDWENGKLTAQSVRYRLESIVRKAYRSSAALGATLASQQSGLQGWSPDAQIFTTDYLKALLADIRSNLRDYKSSDKGEVARRRAVLRMQHSAGVAAERGYTDSVIASYKELADFGYELRKIWMANFVGNVPCPECKSLHGEEVGLEDEFPSPTLTKTKIYHNLLGPPRHPRCQCFLVVLIVTLENAFEKLDIDHPDTGQTTMTTDDVQKMPNKIFTAVVKTLQKIISFVRK